MMEVWTQEHKRWLAKLCVGDQCVSRQSMASKNPYRILTVIKVMDDYVDCRYNDNDRKARFMRSGGMSVSDSPYPETIKPYTTEIREEIRHYDLVSAVSEAAFKFQHPGQCEFLPDELLLRMSAVFQEAVGIIKEEIEE